jgi:uncharacterized SAM-dependent methyltransferase
MAGLGFGHDQTEGIEAALQLSPYVLADERSAAANTLDQTVTIDGETFHFEQHERICTEHSHKFTVDRFGTEAAETGWSLERTWTDRDDLFATLLFRAT